MRTKKVLTYGKDWEERQIVDPPHTVFGCPALPQSQDIIMKVGGLRKMIKDLNDEDSFRITWYASRKTTEYSYIKPSKKHG